MTTGIGIALIVGGIVVIALSRVFADAFSVPGSTSAFTRLAHLGDDAASRYYRWALAVVIGLALVIGGVAVLFGG